MRENIRKSQILPSVHDSSKNRFIDMPDMAVLPIQLILSIGHPDKFPKKRYAVDSFLSDLSYELVYTPRHMPGNLFDIRDINDYPVLYTAIIENIDIFITGDKDFLDVEIEMPEIMMPGEFLEKVIKNS